MDSEGGITTNTHPSMGDSNTLSESTGILMECALINNDKNLFDMEYRYIKVNLVTENFFIKWKEGNDVFCNASIDDLRIIGALLEAYEKWGEKIIKILHFCCRKKYMMSR